MSACLHFCHYTALPLKCQSSNLREFGIVVPFLLAKRLRFVCNYLCAFANFRSFTCLDAQLFSALFDFENFFPALLDKFFVY